MMREIKFRAKRIDNGEWVYGYYVVSKTSLGIEVHQIKSNWTRETYEIDIETLGQFTGLYDKNGKEIYEGDIVEWQDYRMVIVWGDIVGEGFGFKWELCKSGNGFKDSITGFIDDYEVIGNIYDNEELLDGIK